MFLLENKAKILIRLNTDRQTDRHHLWYISDILLKISVSNGALFLSLSFACNYVHIFFCLSLSVLMIDRLLLFPSVSHLLSPVYVSQWN